MRKKNNLKNNLHNRQERNLSTERASKCFLEHLEAQILKIFLLAANHGGVFIDSMYVPVCPKKLWICHWCGIYPVMHFGGSQEVPEKNSFYSIFLTSTFNVILTTLIHNVKHLLFPVLLIPYSYIKFYI